MVESSMKVKVVWTSKLGKSNLWERISSSFFLVQKYSTFPAPNSKSSVVRIQQPKKHEVSQKTLCQVLLMSAKPKLLWMPRRRKPWACVSWRVYRAAFVALSVPCQCQVCLHLQCLKQLVKQLKNEFPKNLRKLSSFLFLKSPTLLSPPRHVLGFLGVLSPF